MVWLVCYGAWTQGVDTAHEAHFQVPPLDTFPPFAVAHAMLGFAIAACGAAPVLRAPAKVGSASRLGKMLQGDP